MKEVNSQLRYSSEKLRSFPGTTLKYLKYYIVSSLIDETTDRIILHGGCNDVNNKNSTPKKTANEITDYGRDNVVIIVLMISLYQR